VTVVSAVFDWSMLPVSTGMAISAKFRIAGASFPSMIAVSRAFVRSRRLTSTAVDGTSVGQAGESGTFMNSFGFWAIIAAVILGLFVVIVIFIRWRFSSDSTLTSMSGASTGNERSWLASDAHSKLKELRLDCDNPLWESDEDLTMAVMEITEVEEVGEVEDKEDEVL
jgi:hypothetical protein